MNLSLMNPKELVNVYPDMLEYVIRLGDTIMGTVIQFNKRGLFLAVGCSDGRIVIFDFQTRTINKQLLPPAKAYVMSIDWINNGRHIVASYYGTCVCIWDVALNKIVKRYNHSVWRATVSKTREKYCVLSLTAGSPILINMKTQEEKQLNIISFQHKTRRRVDYNFACFDHLGDRIFVGNSIGQISVFRTKDQKLLAQFHVSSEAAQISDDPKDIVNNINNVQDLPAKLKKGDYGVKQILFSEQGKQMLVNCETVIRLFQETTDVVRDTRTNKQHRKSGLIFQTEFKDLVNNRPFNTCGFSGWNSLGVDSEFVSGTNGNDIYIWDRSAGELVKLLEGPKEDILWAIWHPYRPIIVSCTNGGSMHIWSRTPTENWSSFAPDFQEVDDNEFYIEREDEFDEVVMVDDNNNNSVQKEKEEEEKLEPIVDIVTLSEDQQKNEQEFLIATVPVRDRELKKYYDQLNFKTSTVKHSNNNKKKKIPTVPSALKKKTPTTKRTTTTSSTRRKTPAKKRRRKIESDSESDTSNTQSSSSSD
jgi:COMPASS component SWD1